MNRTVWTLILLAAVATAQQPEPKKDSGSQPFSIQAEPAPVRKPDKSQPMARSNEELAEYNAVLSTSTTDLAAAKKLAAAFVEKYPESELKVVLYSRLMQTAFGQNDADRVLEFADRVLALEPENTIALVLSATVYAERTEETDLDRDPKLTKGESRAETAIRTIDTGLVLPAGITPEQAQGAKNMLLGMAHASLGQIATIRRDFPAAEKHLSESARLTAARPDPLTLYRLAVALHQQKKFKDAKAANEKALAAAQAENNTHVLELAKKEKEILDQVK
jgi:tetratricopeptide (TPR) repeat protein